MEEIRDVHWVGVLANAEYYRQLPELMRNAATSIKVAMFHAAFVSGNHPTKALLDELVAAHKRGVASLSSSIGTGNWTPTYRP